MATKIVNDNIVKQDSLTSITTELNEVVSLLKEEIEITKCELGKTKMDIFKLYDHLVKLKFVVGGCAITVVYLILLLLTRS